MKPSKMNQLAGAADEKQSKKSGEHELAEEALASVHGGELSPQDVTHITRLANEAGKHHGVSIRATALDYGAGAAIDFAAFTGGEAAFKKKKNS
jgi:hypothetical protein